MVVDVKAVVATPEVEVAAVGSCKYIHLSFVCTDGNLQATVAVSTTRVVVVVSPTVAEVALEATTSSKVAAARVAGRSTVGAFMARVCARHVDERNDRMIKRTK